MKITDHTNHQNYKESVLYEKKEDVSKTQNTGKTPNTSKVQNTGGTKNTSKTQNTGKSQNAGKLKQPNTLPRKKLNYNSREIRSALVRVTRSQSAGLVLNTAKSKLVSLLKCKGAGMYNENELNAAIGHARRMVRCAQLKLRNLTKEEQQKHRNEKAAEKEAADPHLKQVQKALRLKQRKLALEQKRRLHRNLEHAKMNQADEEYKSKQARNQKEEKYQASPSASANRDLSDLKLRDLELRDLELRDLELQIGRESALLSMESAGGADFLDETGMTLDAAIPLTAFSPTASLSGSFEGSSAAIDFAGGAIDIGL